MKSELNELVKFIINDIKKQYEENVEMKKLFNSFLFSDTLVKNHCTVESLTGDNFIDMKFLDTTVEVLGIQISIEWFNTYDQISCNVNANYSTLKYNETMILGNKNQEVWIMHQEVIRGLTTCILNLIGINSRAIDFNDYNDIIYS